MKKNKNLVFRGFPDFVKGLIFNRRLVSQLVEKDIREEYLGSFLGILWAFIQPLFFIMAIWFVFAIGLRGARMSGDVPFLLYLIPGMVMWLFFSNSLNNGANSIVKNSYLVKQMVFRVSLLPVVKIISSMTVHFFFLVMVLVVFAAHGFFPDLYYLQLIYYLGAAFFLLLGITFFTSAVLPFFRDLNQVIQIVVRLGFWFTPIFWNIDKIPHKYQILVKANPAYYLVMGYRDCLIYKVWFWERPLLSAYFWFFALVVFLLGAIVFRRTKPHFADVL